MLLLLADAHSKWPEMHELPSMTTDCTITLLRSVFATYGLPEQVVSDNRAQFTSQEFAEFLRSNGIKHARTAPYHPSSNGAVERLVQTFKQAMKAGEGNGFSLQHHLQSFLMTYRSTLVQKLITIIIVSAATHQNKVRLATPKCRQKGCCSSREAESYHDRKGSLGQFTVSARVMVRDGRDKSH